jgi:hypothetical protein
LKQSGGATLGLAVAAGLVVGVSIAQASGSGYVLVADCGNGAFEQPTGGTSTGSATAKVEMNVSGSGTPTVTVVLATEAWVTGQYTATNCNAGGITVTATVDAAGNVTVTPLGINQNMTNNHGGIYTSIAGSTHTDYTAHASGTVSVAAAVNGAIISSTGTCTVKRYQVDVDFHTGGALPDVIHTIAGAGCTISRVP